MSLKLRSLLVSWLVFMLESEVAVVEREERELRDRPDSAGEESIGSAAYSAK